MSLIDLAEGIEWPDDQPASGSMSASMGQLTDLASWAAQTQGRYPPGSFRRPRLLIFTASHGITERGVSGYAEGAESAVLAGLRASRGVVGALAEAAGVGVRIVDTGRSSRPIDREDALYPQQLVDALAVGSAVADDEVDSGTDLVIVANVSAGSTTVAATLVSIITGVEPVKTTGRGVDRIDDDTWMRKASAVRDARRLGVAWRADPTALLRVSGGTDVAAMAAFLLRAAARRTPVLLDGVVATAAALVAHQASPRAKGWWQPAQVTAEPAQDEALKILGLRPILDLGVEAGDGTAGLLALQLLQSAVLIAASSADSSAASSASSADV
jgi:nicotinate-nucleotide--dimethylbenzimidazole phosphoribosyltransferase